MNKLCHYIFGIDLPLGIIAGGVIAGLYFGSWRLAFLFTGIPGLFLAFLAWRLREPRRNEEAAALRASAVAISILFIHLLGDAFAPQLVGVLAQVFDPTHGQHFLKSVAGNDLRLAFLVTCVPAVAICKLLSSYCIIDACSAYILAESNLRAHHTFPQRKEAL